MYILTCFESHLGMFSAIKLVTIVKSLCQMLAFVVHPLEITRKHDVVRHFPVKNYKVYCRKTQLYTQLSSYYTVHPLLLFSFEIKTAAVLSSTFQKFADYSIWTCNALTSFSVSSCSSNNKKWPQEWGLHCVIHYLQGRE